MKKERYKIIFHADGTPFKLCSIKQTDSPRTNYNTKAVKDLYPNWLTESDIKWIQDTERTYAEDVSRYPFPPEDDHANGLIQGILYERERQAAELDKLRTALQKALKLSQDTTHPDADYLLEEIEEVIKSALKP